jgi:glycosyltransferase involved in cell wall biosynthesis
LACDDVCMATDIADEPRHTRTEVTEHLTVLTVCDEWFPASGGISAFNRYLCRALAQAGHSVFCLVPSASSDEHEDARECRTRLVDAAATFGHTTFEALAGRPVLPDGVRPTVVVGHARFTGPMAKALADQSYPQAARLHFVHMHPDRIEWGKGDREDAAFTAEQHTIQERELCETATRTIAVGPLLHEYALSKLTYGPRVADAVQIVPGFDAMPPVRRHRLGRALIMVLGRVHNENKGLALAAKAVGYAVNQLGHSEDDLELYLRGVRPGRGADVRRALLEWSGLPGLTTTIRNYTENPAAVLADLATISLVLMPSFEEDFGLVGWEALCAGVPVLISARSGLGTLIRASGLPGDLVARVVLDVRKDDAVDVPLWASHISRVLHNREAAFRTAEQVLAFMAGRHTWAAAVEVVEDAVRGRQSPTLPRNGG